MQFGNGTVDLGSTGSGNYFYGTTIVLNAGASAGHTWGGWISSNGGLVGNQGSQYGVFGMPAGNVGMTATATVNNYTLYYVKNGGVNNQPANQTVPYGTNVRVDFSANPTRNNAVFLGWSTNQNASTPEYRNVGYYTIQVNENIILYAIWHVHVASCYHVHIGSDTAQTGCYSHTANSSFTYVNMGISKEWSSRWLEGGRNWLVTSTNQFSESVRIRYFSCLIF